MGSRPLSSSVMYRCAHGVVLRRNKIVCNPYPTPRPANEQCPLQLGSQPTLPPACISSAISDASLPVRDTGRHTPRRDHDCARLPRMPLIIILVVLLLLFGGGGYYMGPGVGYYGGGGLSLILLLLVLYLLFGRGRGRL